MTLIIDSGWTQGDPNYNEVTLLLHGNGTNGSTTITDSSPSPKTVTPVGNAQISTAIADPFDNSTRGVLAFDGTGDWLTIPGSADFNQQGDFTIETWMYIQSAPSVETISIYGYEVFDYIKLALSPSRQIRADISGRGLIGSASSALNLSQWYHIAMVRSGLAANNCKIYIDGTQSFAFTNTANCVNAGATVFIMRGAASSATFGAYLDEFRVTKAARYTANFPPPTEPFADGYY